MVRLLLFFAILFLGYCLGRIHQLVRLFPRIKELERLSDKHLMLFLMMNDWVRLSIMSKTVKEYFKRNGYTSVAIYGMSYVGETLNMELAGSDIKVLYAIDRNTEACNSLEVLNPEDDLPPVDIVVVTAIQSFESIRDSLVDRVKCPVVSLDDIVYENYIYRC